MTTKGKLRDEQGAVLMTWIEPSYVPDSSGQHYPLAGSETNYGNMGQAYARLYDGLEANLSRKVSALEREKLALRRDLDWVMKKSISRMLVRVFRSEQFDHELVKVRIVFVERGRELGRQEACDLLMANQRLPGFDPNLPRKVKNIVRGFKKTRWVCMESLTSSPDLSSSLLRSVLDHGDSGAGEGLAVDLQHKVFKLYNK
nr:hypothetical protein [Tanacetum cinerariifolium]